MYAQVSTIIMGYLKISAQKKLSDLCDRNPSAFIAIAEGDESKPIELDFSDVFESAADLSALAGDYVYVVADGENETLAKMSQEVQAGFFAGETTYII